MSFMIAKSNSEFKPFFFFFFFFKRSGSQISIFQKVTSFFRQNVKTRIKNSFRMLVLTKFSEGMMTIYTDEWIKNMPTWNHVNKGEVKRSRTALNLCLLLTSFITPKRNMMKILFLQQWSLVEAYTRCGFNISVMIWYNVIVSCYVVFLGRVVRPLLVRSRSN